MIFERKKWLLTSITPGLLLAATQSFAASDLSFGGWTATGGEAGHNSATVCAIVNFDCSVTFTSNEIIMRTKTGIFPTATSNFVWENNKEHQFFSGLSYLLLLFLPLWIARRRQVVKQA